MQMQAGMLLGGIRLLESQRCIPRNNSLRRVWLTGVGPVTSEESALQVLESRERSEGPLVPQLPHCRGTAADFPCCYGL